MSKREAREPRGRRQLLALVEAGDASAVRAALARDPGIAATTDDLGRNLLMVAVSSPERSMAMIEALLAGGVRADAIDASGFCVLHWAIDINASGDDLGPLARRLVEAGAPLEHRTPLGWTPLTKAVLSGTAVEVAALVALGARVDVSLPADTVPAFAGGRSLRDLARNDAGKLRALEA